MHTQEPECRPSEGKKRAQTAIREKDLEAASVIGTAHTEQTWPALPAATPPGRTASAIAASFYVTGIPKRGGDHGRNSQTGSGGRACNRLKTGATAGHPDASGRRFPGLNRSHRPLRSAQPEGVQAEQRPSDRRKRKPARKELCEPGTGPGLRAGGGRDTKSGAQPGARHSPEQTHCSGLWSGVRETCGRRPRHTQPPQGGGGGCWLKMEVRAGGDAVPPRHTGAWAGQTSVGERGRCSCQRQGSRRPPPLRHPKSDQLPGPLTGRGRLGPLLAPPRLPGGKEGL